MKLLDRSLVLSAAVFFSSFAASAATPVSYEKRMEETKTKLQAVEQIISTLSSNKTCEADGQCDTLEMGERACGGPEKYLIISTANPKLNDLKSRLAEYSKIQKELNGMEAVVTCTPSPTAPEVQCIKQQCAEHKPGDAAPSAATAPTAASTPITAGTPSEADPVLFIPPVHPAKPATKGN